jgi:hypothetical protein
MAFIILADRREAYRYFGLARLPGIASRLQPSNFTQACC